MPKSGAPGSARAVPLAMGVPYAPGLPGVELPLTKVEYGPTPAQRSSTIT